GALHVIGVRGLCNALRAGHRGAPRQLARVADGGSVEVRRRVIECVADNPKELARAGSVALGLAQDPGVEVGREAAGILATLSAGEPSKEVGEALARLARDPNREVRVVALGALAALGPGAPKPALEALPRAFDQGDEAERLVVLEAARKM